MTKLRIFLFMFLFSLVFVSSPVYATPLSEAILQGRENKLPDVPSDKLNDYPYYFVVYSSQYNWYQLHMFRNLPVVSDVYSNGSAYISSGGNIAYLKMYTSDLSSWGNYGGHSNSILITGYDSYGNVDECVVYSNFDIKDSSGNVLYLSYEVNSAITEEEDDSGFWSSLFNRLTDGFSAIVDALINIFNKMIEIFQNVIDVILGIPQAILDGLSNLIEYLFVPVASRNLFDEVKILFESKFGIFNQFRDLVESILSPNFYDGTPKFEITYKGSKYEIIDFAIISPYRTFIINLTGFLMIFSTILWLIKNGATLIHNGSASSDTVKE